MEAPSKNLKAIGIFFFCVCRGSFIFFKIMWSIETKQKMACF